MTRHINRTVERPQFREFQRGVAHALLIDDWEFLDGYTDGYFREAGYGDVWIMYMRGPYRTLKIHGRTEA